jgi:hypothetical protein
MLERLQPVLRIVCLLLAGLVIYQLSQILAQKDPLKNLGLAATFAALDAAGAPAANPGTNAAPGRESPRKQADVPAAVQTRIDRITQSEILGPVVRPLPMALIGIAGKDVLLRTAAGQTGLLRVGEELGGVKLLRIGTNRVLVEHEQQQKELTVFSGVGGETLLPKEEKKTQ